MALASHQHMAGIDLAYVHEGDGLLVLEDLGGRDLAGREAAEDALARGRGVDEHRHGLVLLGG
jgi:hypothetical protein